MKEPNFKFKLPAVLLTVAMLTMLIISGSQSLILPVRADTGESLISDYFPSAQVASVDEGTFSIIWITDTQYLTADHPTYFSSLCRWIVNHQDTYNVKMVVHTGDIVDSEGNVTQWANANDSMSLLLNAGIPYCWDAGNHDYNATCWMGNQFTAFNPTVMAQKSYWVDGFLDGQNTAVHFNVGAQDFLIVNVAYQADDTVLSWANALLDSHPESKAIVAAHFYLNRTSGYEEWASNFRHSVLATHSSVFLTLSAHVYPLAYSGLRTQVGDRHELVFNRQDKDNEMGAASLRILTFNLAEGAIYVQTFYLYSNTFLADDNNQFTLNTTFRNDGAPNENTEIPELPVTAVLVLCVLLLVAVFVCRSRLKLRQNRNCQNRI